MSAEPSYGAPTWYDVAIAQDGVISRSQLIEHGWTSRRVQHRIDGGRWRRLRPGVYATFTGPVSSRAAGWAAVLYAGDGAA